MDFVQRTNNRMAWAIGESTEQHASDPQFWEEPGCSSRVGSPSSSWMRSSSVVPFDEELGLSPIHRMLRDEPSTRPLGSRMAAAAAAGPLAESSRHHIDYEMELEDFMMPDIDEVEVWAMLEAAMIERSAVLEQAVQNRMDTLFVPADGADGADLAGFGGEAGPSQAQRNDGRDLGAAPEDGEVFDMSSLEKEKASEEVARQEWLRASRTVAEQPPSGEAKEEPRHAEASTAVSQLGAVPEDDEEDIDLISIEKEKEGAEDGAAVEKKKKKKKSKKKKKEKEVATQGTEGKVLEDDQGENSSKPALSSVSQNNGEDRKKVKRQKQQKLLPPVEEDDTFLEWLFSGGISKSTGSNIPNPQSQGREAGRGLPPPPPLLTFSALDGTHKSLQDMTPAERHRALVQLQFEVGKTLV